jgi:hypothetical protein
MLAAFKPETAMETGSPMPVKMGRALRESEDNRPAF